MCMFTENDLNIINYDNAIVLINEGIGSIKNRGGHGLVQTKNLNQTCIN